MAPTNLNLLYGTTFRLSFTKLPLTTFFCQGTAIPAVSMSPLEIKTPLNPVQLPSTVMTFGTLSVKILADEFLDGYNELFQWMQDLSAVESTDQYVAFLHTEQALYGGKSAADLNYSSALLEILNQNQNVIRRIRIFGAFPIGLGEIAMSVDAGDVPIRFEAQFGYTEFEIEPRQEDVLQT